MEQLILLEQSVRVVEREGRLVGLLPKADVGQGH
jgi:hypothetical protein